MTNLYFYVILKAKKREWGSNMGLDMFIMKKATDRKRTSTELAYWRKANAIHKWFVDNTAYDSDTCTSTLTKEDLLSIKNVCIDILDKCKDGVDEEFCKENLPTMSGFFFGSLEYNEFYIGNVESTIRWCNDILNNYVDDLDKGNIIYYASW